MTLPKKAESPYAVGTKTLISDKRRKKRTSAVNTAEVRFLHETVQNVKMRIFVLTNKLPCGILKY